MIKLWLHPHFKHREALWLIWEKLHLLCCWPSCLCLIRFYVLQKFRCYVVSYCMNGNFGLVILEIYWLYIWKYLSIRSKYRLKQIYLEFWGNFWHFAAFFTRLSTIFTQRLSISLYLLLIWLFQPHFYQQYLRSQPSFLKFDSLILLIPTNSLCCGIVVNSHKTFPALIKPHPVQYAANEVRSLVQWLLHTCVRLTNCWPDWWRHLQYKHFCLATWANSRHR